MSLGGNLSGISFGGLASGIDTQGIISKMLQLEAVPVARLQNQQKGIVAQQGIFSQFESQLTALSQASGVLNSPATFDPIAATSSDTTVATIATSSGAQSGSYNLTVKQLAQAQKIASAPQTGTTTALNLTGQFVVDGKGVAVVASDSLQSIAQKVNSLGVGVTASLISGGTGAAYLTFASTQTGLANQLQISDLSGGVLNSLGVLGASSIRSPIVNGAASYGFSSNTASVGSMLGLSGIAAGSFSINGVLVSPPIDLNSDSLQNIADKINGSSVGATATVVSKVANGQTTYGLQIVGTTSTPTFSDPNNILGAIGILQGAASSQLVAAQDAQFSLDTVQLSSSSNTVTTAIPGATLTLLKGTPALPASSTLSLNRDTTAISASIGAFTSAYNGLIDFVAQNSKLDTKTFQSGPLFGDPTAQGVMNQVTNLVFNTVPGLTGPYQNLAQIGFTIDQSNHLVVDSSKLNAALAANPDAVGQVFRTSGSTSNANLSYISSASKTVATGASSYPVNITQIATKGAYTAELAHTAASTAPETITFNGSLFSSIAYQLTLPTGSTLASTIAAINNDPTLKNLVSASSSSGSLTLTSLRYGTNGNFTAYSNLQASASNSGVGIGMLGAKVTGVDVAGTINGEAATGNGQYLTGASGNPKTDGLQIQYSGVVTGAIGTVQISKGIGTQVSDLVGQVTDTANGILSANDQSLQKQIDDISKQIADLQTQIQADSLRLQQIFANMENTISHLQSQSGQLAGLSVGTSTSSSTGH